MAIPKICGIETEYGIVHRGVEEPNPIFASSILINAYLESLGGSRIGWDFQDETPSQDARGSSLRYTAAPEVETHLVNAVLTNGARFYVDHAHPEYSAPECSDAIEAVLYDRAGEETLLRAMTAVNAHLPPGEEIVVYKNNSDGKGNSYGCHENYLMDRSVPFSQIVAVATLHFVTRQIFTGSGKVGSELPGTDHESVDFQITQRADFFEENVGLETTLKRPIVNTRDEPHADASKYRRLHVIAGDANIAETATFLKVGTTAAVLSMLEDSMLDAPLVFRDPVRAMQKVSRDLTLGAPLELSDGTTATALELQWDLYQLAETWADRHGMESIGSSTGRLVLDRWQHVLTTLESDRFALADQIDWIAKLRLFEAYMERHDAAWSDPRIAAMDLQYHDLRPESSLSRRLGLSRIVAEADVERAITDPPEGTRAYFRGTCLSRFPDAVAAANWDSMVFDTGANTLQRVPMMEPGRGSRDAVGEILDRSGSAAELLRLLGG